MSDASARPLPGLLRHELEVLHGNWAWYLILGIILIVLGTFALVAPFVATLATVTLISAMLILGGITQMIGAFWARRWSGFFTLLLVGILYLVVGVLIWDHPLKAAADLTLVIAVLLVVGGAFRIATALTTRYPNWVWILLNGVITLVLGLMIWRQWPATAPWVIGTFVGVDLIFNGWTWIMFAVALRRLPAGRPSTP